MLGIYTRLSQEEEESSSIENQIKEGKAFARLHNFDDLEIYNEGEGVSGSLDIEGRPILSTLVKDINSGKITAIWARNQNRIERSNFVYGFFVRLVKKYNVRVFFADKEVDFNDPSQKMLGTVLSGINEYQLELQAVQIKKVLRSRAEEGKISGHICFGYMRDDEGYQVPHPEKAKLVKEIFTRYAEGEGVPTICQDFIKRDIPPIFVRSNKSGLWSPVGMYVVLRNTTYFGDKNHAGKVYSVPAIIDKDLFNRVQAKLKIGTMKASTRNFYVLNTLLTCGTCGNRVAGRSFGSDAIKYYMCSKKRYGTEKCNSRIVRMDDLDTLIWDTLFADDKIYEEVKKSYLDGDNEVEKEKAKIDIAHYGKVKEKYSKQLLRIKDMVVEGLFTIKEGKAKIQEIDSSITAAKDKVEESELRLKDLQGERKLLVGYKQDKVMISAEVIASIFDADFQEEGYDFLGDIDNYEALNSPEVLIPKDAVEIYTDEVKVANKKVMSKDAKEKSRLIKKYVEEIVITTISKGKFSIKVRFRLPIEDKVHKLNHVY